MRRKLALVGGLCALLVATGTVAHAACTPTGITPLGPPQISATASSTVTILAFVHAGQTGCPGATVTFNAANFTPVTKDAVADASGAAQATFTAPPYNSSYTVTASVTDGTNTYTTIYTITVTGGTAGFPGTGTMPSAILPIGSTTLNVSPGASVTLPVQVTDASGVAASGVYVTFNASGGLTPATTTVATISGYAQASFQVPLTASATYAVYVYGTYTTLAPAAFTINVGTGGGGATPGGTGGVSVVSGNGQVVSQSFPAPKPLLVQVTDQTTGKPAPNVSVTWAVTSGAGPSLSCGATGSCSMGSSYYGGYLGSVITTTDANGQASVNVFGSSFVSGTLLGPLLSTITASTATGSAVFYLTTLPTSGGQPAFFTAQLIKPESRSITAAAGSTVTDAIEMRASSAFPGLSYVGLDVTSGNDPAVGPTASCKGGTALSDLTGLAVCDLIVGPKTGTTTLTVTMGGTSTQTVTLEVTAGAPAAIKVVQGDQQTGNAGQTLPLALVGQVTDVGGNPLPGTSVTWQVVTPGSLTLTGLTSTTTDQNGRASTLVKLGSSPGTFKVTLTAGTATATFNITVNASLGPLQKISGDLQTAVVGTAFAQPVVVQVKDQSGAVLPGVAVTFSATGGTVGTASATTDASGNASTTVTAGSTAGPVVVTAAAGNLTTTFNLTARLPGPTLTADSFKNGAGFQTGVVAGSIVTIQGAGIAPGVTGCVGSGTVEGPLPLSLGGVEVMFGDKPAPVYSVCNSGGVEQATVQAPFELGTGSVTATVKVQGGSSTVNNVQVLPAQPGIFQIQVPDGRLYGVVVRPDGSFVSPDNPAKRGEIEQLYVTGLGPVMPAAGTNRAGVPGQNVHYPVIVGVNNAGVRVLSATYAENLIGAYVITFQVPEDAQTGQDLALSVAVSTGSDQPLVYSNPSRIAVQ